MASGNNPAGEPRPPLEGQRFDVVVIGGGINGAAIARECARGGKRTLLVEQHDFAAGTTSRSTRLIHGGLRYLEHGDIAQVRESLRARQQLRNEYPNLVTPLEFVLALGEGSRRSALAVRTGLWFYRKLGGVDAPNRNAADQLERLLDAGRRFSIFSFEDAQCEFPERLVATWLMEATAHGCVARNRTRVLQVLLRDGTVAGVLLRDLISGREEQVQTTWVINATGPWADRVCQQSEIHTAQPMIGGVRGSHIVLPALPGAPQAAVYTEGTDGRPIFVIPWNGQLLVGTTEVADSGDPDRTQPSSEEIDYLLASFRRVFPRIATTCTDVKYCFAGVRPLPYSPSTNPSTQTRRHFLHDHSTEGARGMISLIGGKLTTAGAAARQCAEKIGICISASARPLIVAEENLAARLQTAAQCIAELGHISLESANALREWHGPRAQMIAASSAERPELRETLCPHTNHVVAEAVDAFLHQCAVSLADVLLRRVPVALGACWSNDCSRQAAHKIASPMGWDSQQEGAELEAFEIERQAFLQHRA